MLFIGNEPIREWDSSQCENNTSYFQLFFSLVHDPDIATFIKITFVLDSLGTPKAEDCT